jgi:D-psicose/D-tagatose/L-ribulose 3-epimerase
MPQPIRHAMCNEAFEQTPFAEVCKTLRSIGYEGVEIAPFTLAPDPVDITAAQRREYSDIIRSEGLTFVGLHWLMVSPKGLHVTTPDDSLRERSWRHIRNLIDLCADLGPGGLMIFGSPLQRSATGGLTREQATRHYVEGLASVAPQAQERGVTILVEALPMAQSDVVQNLGEAAAIVHAIDSPAIQTMFDTHNAVDETVPHTALIEKYFDVIKHVHVNEMDGRYPGTGTYDFGALLKKLQALDYQGWVSLEAFDFKPSAREIAQASYTFLKNHE